MPAQIRSRFCAKRCDQAARQADGRDREKHLKRKYGITSADYDRMLADQSGGCALCGVKPEALKAGRFREFLHVDHDHDTGKVRALLCPDCNLMIGRRDLAWFRRVVTYLSQ